MRLIKHSRGNGGKPTSQDRERHAKDSKALAQQLVHAVARQLPLLVSPSPSPAFRSRDNPSEGRFSARFEAEGMEGSPLLLLDALLSTTMRYRLESGEGRRSEATEATDERGVGSGAGSAEDTLHWVKQQPGVVEDAPVRDGTRQHNWVARLLLQQQMRSTELNVQLVFSLLRVWFVVFTSQLFTPSFFIPHFVRAAC